MAFTLASVMLSLRSILSRQNQSSMRDKMLRKLSMTDGEISTERLARQIMAFILLKINSLLALISF
jgi:hypothetical protein